ncbi:MAG: late competence development ComFB family protein [Gracilibacteraceae bacterium]|jgi:hypothetical protein|nr:late competence development ComFB family protein [Gracilibacteraceae bacterium]
MAGNKKFTLKSEQLFEKIALAGEVDPAPTAPPTPPLLSKTTPAASQADEPAAVQPRPAPPAPKPPAPKPPTPAAQTRPAPHTAPRRLNLPHDTDDRVPLVPSSSGGRVSREFSEEYRQPVNLMYNIVTEHIGRALRDHGICDCPRCRMEAAALTLNKINSKYVSVFSPAMALEDYYFKKNFAEITSAMLLACATVKNAPWHRPSERPREEVFIENVMERVVSTIIKDMSETSPTCQCERCVGDISAFILNDLPKYYRVGTVRQLISYWISAKKEYDSLLVPLYEHYAGRVAEHPLH